MKNLIRITESQLKTIINEGYSDSKQERIDRAIYLHYVENNQYNDMKYVSKQKFFDILKKIDQFETKVIEFDKKRIYRLSDKKEIYFTKRGNRIGEVWTEEEDLDDPQIESYWIDKNFIDFF